MFQHFRESGYETNLVGKVFHRGTNDPLSGTDTAYLMDINQVFPTGGIKTFAWRAFSREEVAAYPLRETLVANTTIELLHKAARSSSKPWFITAGFYKPHLPFVFPAPFFDYYPASEYLPPAEGGAARNGVGFPIAMRRAVNSVPVSFNKGVELLTYEDIQRIPYNDGNLTENMTTALRRGYFAAISYVDYEFGRIMAALTQLGLSTDTIVVLSSDHGFHLGELTQWCKQTNFKIATSVPLVIHEPLLANRPSVQVDGMVELVDIAPTISEMAGVAIPRQCPPGAPPDGFCTEGTSLVALLGELKEPAGWKSAAFSQFHRKKRTIMGYSVTTKRWRYTEWVNFNKDNATTDWTLTTVDTGGKLPLELYDHTSDPYETRNLAFDAQYARAVAKLRRLLRKGWRFANATAKETTLPATTSATAASGLTAPARATTAVEYMTSLALSQDVTEATHSATLQHSDSGLTAARANTTNDQPIHTSTAAAKSNASSATINGAMATTRAATAETETTLSRATPLPDRTGATLLATLDSSDATGSVDMTAPFLSSPQSTDATRAVTLQRSDTISVNTTAPSLSTLESTYATRSATLQRSDTTISVNTTLSTLESTDATRSATLQRSDTTVSAIATAPSLSTPESTDATRSATLQRSDTTISVNTTLSTLESTDATRSATLQRSDATVSAIATSPSLSLTQFAETKVSTTLRYPTTGKSETSAGDNTAVTSAAALTSGAPADYHTNFNLSAQPAFEDTWKPILISLICLLLLWRR